MMYDSEERSHHLFFDASTSLYFSRQLLERTHPLIRLSFVIGIVAVYPAFVTCNPVVHRTESTKTFQLLLGETSRRLHSLARRLGGSVERARPYHEAVGSATAARDHTQRAALHYQRASVRPPGTSSKYTKPLYKLIPPNSRLSARIDLPSRRAQCQIFRSTTNYKHLKFSAVKLPTHEPQRRKIGTRGRRREGQGRRALNLLFTSFAGKGRQRQAQKKTERQFQLHAAAKETVSLAEQRFVSKQHEWQFDSNWQEVLNHAIIKVMDAEKRKAESGREHQKRAAAYIAAERKASSEHVAQLEENLKRHIIKSRIYFEEKKLCDEQLNAQNEKIEKLQRLIADAKYRYSKSLKALEEISEEIHRRRGEYPPCKDTYPVGPREPGVGAEREPTHEELAQDALDSKPDEESSLQELRMRVRELALKPIDRADVETDEAWAQELNETINKLDQLLMMKETNQQRRSKFTTSGSEPTTSTNTRNRSPPGDGWGSVRIKNLSKSREQIYEPLNPITKSDKSKSMMSLDVLALARDTTIMDRESYLKAVIEDKSPTGTYTESNSERNDSPDEILMVECDTSDVTQNPVIRMTSSTTTNDEN
ncbi:SH3 domain-binding protein 5 homolog [Eumeta japonica]|uniref:SH3 domain-binding protein 5 homolog n=1 Tax=Eumeta variegata TaxID=151549 RepID=A0A4C1ZCY6_EUMVA|nr:SH3 domain-binding protein 5 homolog [Eumeta japonica]